MGILDEVRRLRGELQGLAQDLVAVGERGEEAFATLDAEGSKGGFLLPDTGTGEVAGGRLSGPSAARGTGSGGGASTTPRSGADGTPGRLGNLLIRSATPGGGFRSVAELDRVCRRDTFDVVSPGHRESAKVEGWTCPDGSIFYDPESYQAALLAPARSSRSQPGAHTGGPRGDRRTQYQGGGADAPLSGLGGSGGGSGFHTGAIESRAAPRVPVTPTPGEREITRGVDRTNKLLEELVTEQRRGRAEGRLALRVMGLT